MKLYCGTYAKYNNGSLEGAWMDLDDYEDADAFLNACYELHKDEKDPELMFQDQEVERDWEEGLYSESCVPREYWEIKEALDNSYINDEVFNAFLSGECEKASVEMVEKCQQCYITSIDSMNPGADYAQMEFEDGHTRDELQRLQWILRYVDWDRVWEDMTYDGYFEENGFIFDRNR